jgi:hypothetical protein
MKRGDEDAALAQQDWIAVELRENLDLWTCLLYAGRADEDAAERLVLSRQLEVRLEAPDLAPVAVSAHDEVDSAKEGLVGNSVHSIPRQEDHPGARPENGLRKTADCLLEAVEADEAPDRRRLSARHDEAVEPLQLLRLPYLDDGCAEPAEHRRMLAEVPLHCEDADCQSSAHLA